MIYIFLGLDFLLRNQFAQGQNYGIKTKKRNHLCDFDFCSSWDYHYTVGEIPGRRMDCNCGSSECRRRVL